MVTMRFSQCLLAIGLALCSHVAAVSVDVSLTDGQGDILPFNLSQPESLHEAIISLPSTLSKIPRAAPKAASTNWCGSLWTKPPSGGFNSAVGTWVVPAVSQGPDGDPFTDEYLYQWVGVGGWEDCKVLIQAGIAITFERGEATIEPWWEIYPEPYTSIRGFKANEGDTITTTVKVTGATSGTVDMTNHKTGQKLHLQISSEDTGAICQQNAEWVLEDPQQSPFPNFPKWSMTGCSATTTDGKTVNVYGSTIVSIPEKCNAAQVSSSEVSFSHP